MAKSRAQRKAEQRKRAAQQRAGGGPPKSDAEAQRETQVPESADVTEAELAERGANLDELKGEPGDAPTPDPPPPAPSRGEVATAEDRLTRRERKRQERDERERAKASEARRKPREEPVERQRGRVLGFLISCWHELRRVQWPDRDTLIQASAVTLIFIAVAAAYLGVLDAIFSEVVDLIL